MYGYLVVPSRYRRDSRFSFYSWTVAICGLATFLLTTNTNTTMKRRLFLVVALLIVIGMQAQDKVGTYYSSYFKKEYKVEASLSSGELSIYFDIEGESNSDNVCINIKGEQEITSFITALTLAKQKYSEWTSVAINNNVTKMSKEMDISFPRVTICWSGSKWWFAFRHRLSPRFMVTESGDCVFVMSGTATASSNEYIDQKYYLAFSTPEDFDMLINAITPAAAKEVLNKQQNVEDLFL